MSTRRRLMMSGGGEINTPYIKDGLVFLLDGIDKGVENGNWIELVNGIEYQNHGVKAEQDCFVFDGSSYFSSKIVLDDIFSIDLLKTTIQLCVKFHNNIDNQYILCAGTQKGTNQIGIRALLQYNKMQFTQGTQSTQYTQTNNLGDGTYSSCYGSYNRNYKDKINVAYSGGYYNPNKEGFSTIGVRSDDLVSFPFFGKIMSIRAYNRILSVEEILYNQQIDNERFHLGL